MKGHLNYLNDQTFTYVRKKSLKFKSRQLMSEIVDIEHVVTCKHFEIIENANKAGRIVPQFFVESKSG